MYESATLLASEQLRMQQPNMAAFAAEFQPPASGHIHTVDCGHHHAEEVHIDHPEDHGAITTDGHEGEHGHHEHVHGKGCGHVGHENASEHIDVPHEHSEHCGHLHHGDAKAHVDKPHEEHTAHHNEAGHKHEHHAGCGHVGYEKAEASIDKAHVHDEHCGHVHHTKAENHVDHDQKQTHETHSNTDHEHHAGYGHVGYEQADAHVDHDHEYTKAHSHSHEAAVHLHQEAEQIPTAPTQHAEEVHRQQLVEVQEQVARTRVEEDARVDSEAEIAFVPEMAKVVEAIPSLEKQFEHAERRETEDAASDLIDTVTEKIIEPEESKPVAETAMLETESISDMPKVDVQPEDLELGEVMAIEESITQPLRSAQEDEPASEDLFTESTISSEAVPVVIDEVAITEVFESLDIEPAVLPVLPADISNEASTAQPDVVIESTSTSQIGDAEPVHAMNGPLMEVATVIAERYEDIEAQLSSTAPQQMQEIQRTLTNIRTALRLSQEQRIMPENVQRQLTQLLQLLGFEDPSRALAAYIHQYGIDFLDTLMARMFELLNQGRYFESLHTLLPQMSDDENTALTTRLGAAVIRLVSGLGERLPSSIVRAA